MTVFVEVAVNVPKVSGVFHYHLPPELEAQFAPGLLVEVPFGQQQVQGVLLSQVETPEVAETKAVTAILDQEITISAAQIEFSRWLSTISLAPLSRCINLMLPAGISKLADRLYTLENSPPAGEKLNPTAQQLANLLADRGPLRGRQIERALPKRSWRSAARALIAQGWLSAIPVLPPPNVRPRYIKTAQLAMPPEQAKAHLEGLSKKANVQQRRQRILEFLIREPDPVAIDWVYAESGGNLADLKILHEKEFVILREEQIWRDPLAGLAYDPSTPLALTPDQQAAWEPIQERLNQVGPSKPILLHGVTGSGKTELYLRAVAEVLTQGKQAIVLVPEIALTAQTVRRFMSRFPGRVGLVHSGLSAGERYDTWRRARLGKLSIVIGPRSALFSPLPDLGLIVVDESHDGSYYQDSLPPYYHARDAAVALAEITGSLCLLGSATPDLTSLQQSRRNRWDYFSCRNVSWRTARRLRPTKNEFQDNRIISPPASRQRRSNCPR